MSGSKKRKMWPNPSGWMWESGRTNIAGQYRRRRPVAPCSTVLSAIEQKRRVFSRLCGGCVMVLKTSSSLSRPVRAQPSAIRSSLWLSPHPPPLYSSCVPVCLSPASPYYLSASRLCPSFPLSRSLLLTMSCYPATTTSAPLCRAGKGLAIWNGPCIGTLSLVNAGTYERVEADRLRVPLHGLLVAAERCQRQPRACARDSGPKE